MSKENTTRLQGVSETLLITLVAHAARGEKWAKERLAQLECDPKKYRDPMTMIMVPPRAKMMDEMAQDFFEKTHSPYAVELGAGLSARYHRLENPYIKWWDVDLKPVIDIKRHLVKETQNYKMINCSLLENGWIHEVQQANTKQLPILVIIEGVLPYLRPEDVRSFFILLTDGLPNGSQVIFDFTNQKVIDMNWTPGSVKRTNTRFHWGINNIKQVESWHHNLHFLEQRDIWSASNPIFHLISYTFTKLTGLPSYFIGRFEIRSKESE